HLLPFARNNATERLANGNYCAMSCASQMQYDTPFQGTGPVTTVPLRQQLKIGFRDMGARSWSTAKNFGLIGALFAGIECGIEGFRGRNDLTNSVGAGFLTGAILARNGGPR